MSASQTARRWLVPAVIVVVAAVIGAMVGVFVADSDDTAAAASVLLEPATTDGPDPFTASVAVGELAEFPATVTAVTAEVQAELPTNTTTGTLTAQGTTPGLYGGTQNEASCNPDQLVTYLEQNPDKAAAWAQVEGIAPDKIAEFVTNLTPVVLTQDTWVTNHGYTNGRATPRQSVLQAGTAVLVDDRGVPRVKCGCGNPLLAPTNRNLATTTGTAWPGYDTTLVIVVTPAPTPAPNLTLIDTTTGDTYQQPTTGAGNDDIREVDFLNRAYSGEGGCQPEATLVDGAWEERHTEGLNVYTESVSAEVEYADATGDGAEDAVIEFTINPGGNVSFSCISVFSIEGSEPREVGVITLSEGALYPGVNFVDVSGGQIIVSEPRHLGSDPRCCPSQFASLFYEFQGGRFVLVNEMVYPAENTNPLEE